MLPQCGQHQTDKQVERRLSCLFKKPSGHNNLSFNEPARKELIRLAVQKTADETGPITAEQAEKAVELIRTGEFSRDIAQSVDTMLARINPSLPTKVIRELPRDVLNSPAVVNGAAIDLSESFDGARNCLSNIVSKKKLTGTCSNAGHTPTLFRNTLKQAYSISVARDAADTLSALIASDNETTRLAIIVYARANGIRISEDDLDTFRGSLLNTDNPDLGPLVHKGLESMKKQYGLEEAERRFKTMNNVGSCD